MAFEMDNLTESGVDDVRDRGNGAGKGNKAQMQPAGESGEDPLGEDRQGLLTHLRQPETQLCGAHLLCDRRYIG
ncbi:hypothetical protein E4U12_002770 [Claviceps purpurea]|nr:hypothetical protein E4U12_002770 [Claviceps purpurea]